METEAISGGVSSMGSTASDSVSATKSAVMIAVTAISDNTKSFVAKRRPFSEMIDRTAFNKPDNLAEATTRLRKNAAYFKVNYMIFLAAIAGVALLMNPFSIFVIATLGAGWTYLFLMRTEPLMISGRQINNREKFLGMSAMSLVVIFFVTSVGHLLLSALGLGLVAIAAHGAFRSTEDLFLMDEEVSQGGGFLSFLSDSSSKASTAVAV